MLQAVPLSRSTHRRIKAITCTKSPTVRCIARRSRRRRGTWR
jgi:hypothetical protein